MPPACSCLCLAGSVQFSSVQCSLPTASPCPLPILGQHPPDPTLPLHYSSRTSGVAAQNCTAKLTDLPPVLTACGCLLPCVSPGPTPLPTPPCTSPPQTPTSPPTSPSSAHCTAQHVQQQPPRPQPTLNQPSTPDHPQQHSSSRHTPAHPPRPNAHAPSPTRPTRTMAPRPCPRPLTLLAPTITLPLSQPRQASTTLLHHNQRPLQQLPLWHMRQ
jgi:hypothetical protein